MIPANRDKVIPSEKKKFPWQVIIMNLCFSKDWFLNNLTKLSSKTLITLVGFFMNQSFLELKFIFSKKAHENWWNLHRQFDTMYKMSKCEPVKILSVFVAFLENMNFTRDCSQFWSKNCNFQNYPWLETLKSNQHFGT